MSGGSAVGSCPDEDLIRRSVTALNAGDVESYLQGVCPDSLRWMSGLDTPLTLNDIRANLSLLTAAFGRLHLREDLLFGANGQVCARWMLQGIQVGDYAGIAPSRREIAVQPCEVYSLAASKVTESWVYPETMSLFNQIAERP
jgi:hypothetical protein